LKYLPAQNYKLYLKGKCEQEFRKDEPPEIHKTESMKGCLAFEKLFQHAAKKYRV
jgi:hypothetical protein